MNLTLLRSAAARRIASLAVVAVLAADVAALTMVSDHRTVDNPTGDQDVVAGPIPRPTVLSAPPSTSTSMPVPVAPTSPPPTRAAPTTLVPATTLPVPPPAPASLLGQIVFISNRTSDPPEPTSGPVTPGSGGYELWAMNPDGSDQRQLTSDGAGNAQPSLSPDGTRIAWIVGDSAVWVMNADGSDARALTDSSGYRMFPRWSPDGSRIAYIRTGDQDDIVIMNADGSAARVLSTPAVEEYSASWSPDGTRLAVNVSGADPGLLVMDVATSTQEWIRQGNSSGPAWSPDGSVILFSDGNQLHTIAPDGTGLRQLSSGPGQHLSGSWSRDGRTIAFDYFAQQPGSSQQIYLMNADGSGSRNITNASADSYEATF